MEKNIESHLIEKRVFKPARAFAKKARIKSLDDYRRMYRESIKVAGEILGARGEGADVAGAVEEGAGMEGAVREVVRGRESESLGELPRPTSARAESEQGSHSLGRRAGRKAHADLSAVASRCLPVRECLEAKQDSQRRSRDYLFADDSGGGDCDAGLRADRRGALGHLWRLQRG